MKRSILMLLGCLLVVASAQATPVIGVSGQGADFPFTYNRVLNDVTGENELVPLVIPENGLMQIPPNLEGEDTAYGAIRNWHQGLSVDGGLVTMNAKGEFIRVFTTELDAWETVDELGNPIPAVNTAMPESEDWVASMTFRYTGPAQSDFAIFAKAGSTIGAEENRLFALVGNGSTDNYDLMFGADGVTSNWYSAASNLDLGTGWNTLVIHFKAASETMDAYLNDILIAEDQTTGHGRYDLLTIQCENTTTGSVVDFDRILVGQVVPEPATLSLLALGGFFALRRRK